MDIKEVAAAGGEKFSRHPWESAKLEVVDRLLKRPDLPPDGLVLDIGCGDAFIAQQLALRYPRARFIGVDNALNPEILPKAEANNFKACQSLKLLPGDEESVDIILLLDVLEHVEHDFSFLKEIASHRRNKKKAVFFITVPAFGCLFSGHDRFLRHFRRYNHRQLLELAGRLQLEVIDYGYFFSSLLPVRLLRVIGEKLSLISPERATGVAGWKERPVLDSLIKRFLLLDFKISRFLGNFNLLLPGLSCYLICRKQGS